MCLSCINPLKGAKPVPGPTITTGVTDLKGRRNCVLRTNIGMRIFSISGRKQIKIKLTKFECNWIGDISLEILETDLDRRLL